MPRVILRDVVERIKDKIDKDSTNLEFYIGGEHFDYGEVVITKKAPVMGSTIGPAFHMHFMPGDVLLMSRNPHLRKAGMVNFEGICSDVSYVCRTKNENILLQSYLPFIFQTDQFWEFAEANKKGSTNFFLNWSDFVRYEFYLPDMDKQRELTELLWAAAKTKASYQHLLALTDELVKSRFVEVITPLLESNQTLPLDDLVQDERPITYGILMPGTNVEGGIPVVKVKDLVNGVIDQTNLLHTTPEIDAGYKRSKLREGDLLISIRGSVGRMAIVPDSLEGANITQDTARLTIKPEFNKVYVRGVLESQPMQYEMERNIRGVAVKGINIGFLRKLLIPVPIKTMQDILAAFYEQTVNSKIELKLAIETINALIRALMQQDFCN